MVRIASHILDTKAGHFNPAKFKDEYENALKKLVKRKASGKPIEIPEEEPDESNVINLMDALRRSVENGKGAGRKRKKTVKRAKKTGRRKAA
jgi:non-homologous end joining protein Ku